MYDLVYSLLLSLYQPPQHTVPSQRPTTVAVAPVAIPTVKLPDEIEGIAGQFVIVAAETDGKVVKWVPLADGLSIIPPGLLRDTKTAVCMAAVPGRYKLLAYTALGDEPSEPKVTTLVLRQSGTKPPTTPVDPPVNPPPTTGSLFFVIVRKDGPADPVFTRVMGDPTWAELKTKGYEYKDYTLTEVKAAGLTVPNDTMLPAVFTLRVSPDRTSKLARGAVPLPDTSEKIRALPDGVAP